MVIQFNGTLITVDLVDMSSLQFSLGKRVKCLAGRGGSHAVLPSCLKSTGDSVQLLRLPVQ